MKVNRVSPTKGKAKAEKLGLTSRRFYEENMSKNAE
jgi:hypothetical protein